MTIIGFTKTKRAPKGGARADCPELGARCNVAEALEWSDALPQSRRLLCPALWASACGAMLVMHAARPMTKAEWDLSQSLLKNLRRYPRAAAVRLSQRLATTAGWMGAW